MTRDEWRNYICCVLTVREELIDENRRHGPGPGEPGAGRGRVARRRSRRTATRRSRSPPGKSFFNQDPNILQFVMENPTDRVTYGDLRMIRAEFEELMQLSIEAGTIKHPIAYETYIDERFARAPKTAAIPL